MFSFEAVLELMIFLLQEHTSLKILNKNFLSTDPNVTLYTLRESNLIVSKSSKLLDTWWALAVIFKYAYLSRHRKPPQWRILRKEVSWGAPVIFFLIF